MYRVLPRRREDFYFHTPGGELLPYRTVDGQLRAKIVLSPYYDMQVVVTDGKCLSAFQVSSQYVEDHNFSDVIATLVAGVARHHQTSPEWLHELWRRHAASENNVGMRDVHNAAKRRGLSNPQPLERKAAKGELPDLREVYKPLIDRKFAGIVRRGRS